MNVGVKEWVDKAEEDHKVVIQLAKASLDVNNAICFHCQQAIEKYMKAVLQYENIRFSKVHSLEYLLGMVKGFLRSLFCLKKNWQKSISSRFKQGIPAKALIRLTRK